jgi:hypothetical protein
MSRVGVSARAYRAIKASFNSLNLQRRVGESLSDVIIRLARQGRLPT